MNTLHFIAKGTSYVNYLIEDREYIGDKFDIVIHTDEPDRIKKFYKNADIRKYEQHVFRYFDKYTLTYKLVQEKKKPVMYIDAGRIRSIFSTDLPHFDEKKIYKIYTNSNWGGIKNAASLKNMKSTYYEDGYWDNILDYFEQQGLSLDKITPLLERVFVFPVNYELPLVIDKLESVRQLFEHNSKHKKHVYKGIGNGEGLALGYALAMCKISNLTIGQLPVVKQKAL